MLNQTEGQIYSSSWGLYHFH